MKLYVYQDKIHNDIAIFKDLKKATEYFMDNFRAEAYFMDNFEEAGEWKECNDDFEPYWKVSGFDVFIYSREIDLKLP